MAKAYAHMINFYDISIIILKISGACIVIYTIISFIIKHKNKKTKIINNDNTNFENNKTLVDFVGLIILGIFLILFFIYSLKIVKVISYLAIPSTIFMIYVIYLKPIFKFKNTSFTYDYSWYGNILVIVPWIISRSDYLEFFQQINNESILQVLTIFFALIQLYLILFCIILNCYFLIKSFAELNVSKTRDNFCKLKNRLEKNFSYNNIELTYKYTNDVIYGSKKISSKVLLTIPIFTFDTIRCMILSLLSYLFVITINPICIFIKFIFEILDKISNADENKINYGISKITLILSLVITYLLLQLNNSIFQEGIISIYEYISTAILIPVILESLLSLKGN